MIRIELNNGFSALVDECDSHVVNVNERWRVRIGKTGVRYAIRNKIDDNGKRSTVFLHREILGLPKREGVVDHIDGDGLNCTRKNLRVVTQHENTTNVAGPRKTNRHSPYLGVGLHRGKWRARIYHDGRLRQIGLFDTAEEANQARLKYEESVWGVAPRREQAFR